MSTHLLNAGKAAWVSEAAPQATYNDRRTLALDGTGSDEKRAFLWYPNPVGRLGDNVLSATLTLYLANAWTGPTTITVERVTQSWRQNSVKWGSSGSTPTVTSTNAATASVTAGSAGDAVPIDLTAMLRDVAGGGAWYGVRITIDTTGPLRVHSPLAVSASVRPTLLVDMSVDPDAPDALKPDGTSFAVEDALPVLRWSFGSSDANAYQAESQVQISETESDYAAPVYDSGWVTNDLTNWDTEADTTAPPSLEDLVQYYWRVRVRDQNGLESAWSDEATFFHVSTGDIQIVDPEYDDAEVADSSPTITWYTDGTEQRQVRIKVWSANNGEKVRLLYTRDWAAQQQDLSTTDTDYPDTYGVGYDSFTIPTTVPSRRGTGAPIISTPGGDYCVEVAMRDEYARKDSEYISDTRYFTFTPTSSVTAPTALTAVAQAYPAVLLQWSRASDPDLWVILRDGVIIAEEDGADRYVGGTEYQWLDYTAQPGVAHTYSVRAKTSGTGVSAAATAAAVTVAPVGVWLMQSDLDYTIALLGDAEVPQDLAETSASFAPLNRRDPVRIVSRIGGYQGSISGVLSDWAGHDAEDYLADLETLVGQYSTETCRLVFGLRNIPVNIGNLRVSQEPSQGNASPLLNVSFDWWQVGEFSVAVN